MNTRLKQTDSIKNIIMILCLHIIFFTSSWFVIKNLNLFISTPIFIILSIIHQKFIGEFLHEGSHFHLNNNKILNEIISNYFVGLFFFVTVKNYRK